MTFDPVKLNVPCWALTVWPKSVSVADPLPGPLIVRELVLASGSTSAPRLWSDVMIAVAEGGATVPNSAASFAPGTTLPLQFAWLVHVGSVDEIQV